MLTAYHHKQNITLSFLHDDLKALLIVAGWKTTNLRSFSKLNVTKNKAHQTLKIIYKSQVYDGIDTSMSRKS